MARPRPDLTPGSLCTTEDRDYHDRAYPEGIVRCYRHVTEARRRTVYAAYGIPPSRRNDYRIDHLVPIELGGDNSALNLWPQPAVEAKAKDRVEASLRAELEAGNISQEDAVEVVIHWWAQP